MLDPTAPLPLYAQIHRRLRDLIVHGVLRPRTRLPSTRLLARELGVSRTTALAAYDQLRAERLVSQRRGPGTRVAQWRTPNRAATTRTAGRSSVAKLSARGQEVATIDAGDSSPAAVPFAVTGGPIRQKNTVDDVIATASWLVGEGYARRGGLVLETGSGAAVMAGAAANVDPGLFGALLLDWPLMDMTRYTLFNGAQ